MELGKPVLDPRDRANWGMSLLLDVLDPDSGDSVLKCCLKLADARVSDYDGEVREGLNGGFTLQWRLPDATPVMGGVGACFLWAADERMCQLTPSLANRSHGVHAHFYGEFWAYIQELQIAEGIRLNKNWYFYDGGGGNLALYSVIGLDLHDNEAPEEEGMNGLEHELKPSPIVSLSFLSPDADHEHGHGGMSYDIDGFSQTDTRFWPNIFRILPWGNTLHVGAMEVTTDIGSA